MRAAPSYELCRVRHGSAVAALRQLLQTASSDGARGIELQPIGIRESELRPARPPGRGRAHGEVGGRRTASCEGGAERERRRAARRREPAAAMRVCRGWGGGND